MGHFTNRYKATEAYLFSHLPMFQRVGATAYRKDLGNIVQLCAHLGNPQNTFPTIHVGGTNGKGSTAHMLNAILQAHGLRAGLYISPHYRDFRERIKVNGSYVTKKFVVDFTERIKPVVETIQPSFFEMMVAMGFDYFAHCKVDVAVIEVGMGGRLDSTNIIQPLLSVITNISLDHTQFLGETLPLIAEEKAGIIKQGVPVVIGETQVETKPVFDRKAQEMNAPIVYADQQFDAQIVGNTLTHTTFDVRRTGQQKYQQLEVNLHGDYQVKNLQTVLQSIELLQSHFAITAAQVQDGLYHLKRLTNFFGRWQVLGQQPVILADSGHNEGGLRLTMQQLSAMSYQKLHFVLGVVSDKDITKMLDLLPKDARYYFAKANIPRGMEAATLKEKAAAFGLQGRAYTSVRNAFQAAKRHAAPADLIYIGGSTFVVAEII